MSKSLEILTTNVCGLRFIILINEFKTKITNNYLILQRKIILTE